MENLFKDNFYTADDGIVYAPNIEDGVVIETGEQVYKRHKDEQIDNCLEPTPEERITKLEEEKSILAENVYQLATILEVMLGGTEGGQTEATTTDTAN